MSGTRVKKFHPIHKRPSKTRDFYGPLPSTDLPVQAKKPTTNKVNA